MHPVGYGMRGAMRGIVTIDVSGSEHANVICQLCTDICKACGQECNKHKVDHCKRCASICISCAEECAVMAAA